MTAVTAEEYKEQEEPKEQRNTGTEEHRNSWEAGKRGRAGRV